jgi:hypothetical protein
VTAVGHLLPVDTIQWLKLTCIARVRTGERENLRDTIQVMSELVRSSLSAHGSIRPVCRERSWRGRFCGLPFRGGSGNVFAVPYIQISKITEAVKIPPPPHFLKGKK